MRNPPPPGPKVGPSDQPDVSAFVVASDESCRERVPLRRTSDALEMRVELPSPALADGSALSLDLVCQVVEGVSHFLLLAERARRELPTTQLELELQAEVDKLVLLGVVTGPLTRSRFARLRQRLFDDVRFVEQANHERGQRYRLANRLAARLAYRLERRFCVDEQPATPPRGPVRSCSRWKALWAMLHDFYGCGQSDKIALASV